MPTQVCLSNRTKATEPIWLYAHDNNSSMINFPDFFLSYLGLIFSLEKELVPLIEELRQVVEVA